MDYDGIEISTKIREAGRKAMPWTTPLGKITESAKAAWQHLMKRESEQVLGSKGALEAVFTLQNKAAVPSWIYMTLGHNSESGTYCVQLLSFGLVSPAAKVEQTIRLQGDHWKIIALKVGEVRHEIGTDLSQKASGGRRWISRHLRPEA